MVLFHPSPLGGWQLAEVKAMGKKGGLSILSPVLQSPALLEVQAAPWKGKLA